LKILPNGRKTCDSVSALNLEAQPAQLDNEDNLICLPEVLFSFMKTIIRLIPIFDKKSIISINRGKRVFLAGVCLPKTP